MKRVTWLKDEHQPDRRRWEEFYRNRWQHDKVVRSTHGVNCTGGCTLADLREGRHRHLGDAGARLPDARSRRSRPTSRAAASAASRTPGISTARCA